MDGMSQEQMQQMMAMMGGQQQRDPAEIAREFYRNSALFCVGTMLIHNFGHLLFEG